jgi:2-succinyl-5-enolpyruvyl-6-hydroxy-3-cyclohexene-1-carboxylate synthase
MNLKLAKNILTHLAERGVHEIVLCSGARNSPFVFLLEEAIGFNVYSFFEERSAAFFALGRIKNHGHPVAVLTTSGTAAAELFPAVIEGHYTGAPLIMVTADRPRKLRGTGAPQSIDQVNLFGGHTETFIDIAVNEPLSLDSWSGHGPLHLNVCFDEPLIDGVVEKDEFKQKSFRKDSRFRDDTLADHFIEIKKFLGNAECPVFLIGPLNFDERETVKEFLLRAKAPVFAEALSGLREDRELRPLLLKSGDPVLSPKYFDALIRIGGMPTVRFWRDLENNPQLMPVLSISSLPYSGLSKGKLIHTDLRKLLTAYNEKMELDKNKIETVFEFDNGQYKKLQQILDRENKSEVAMLHRLSLTIEEDASVYLGNSLPIREWDLAAHRERHVCWDMAGNRGVNGIDGQLSTFLGFASEDTTNWGIFGDLTAMYDLASPWALKQRPMKSTRLVVVNNSGGQIFSRLFKSNNFLNNHNVNFASWAKMWELGYEEWTSVPPKFSSEEPTVIELVPDSESSIRFWKAYGELWPAPVKLN